MNPILLFAGGSGPTETHGSHRQTSPASSLFGAGRDLLFTRFHLCKTSHFTRYQYLQESRFQTTPNLTRHWSPSQRVWPCRRSMLGSPDWCGEPPADVVCHPTLNWTIPSRAYWVADMRADFSLSDTTLSTTMISTTINHQPHQQHINTTIINPPFFPCRSHCPNQQHHLHQQHNLNQQRHYHPLLKLQRHKLIEQPEIRSFVRGQLVPVTSHQYSSSSIFHMLIYIKSELAKPLSNWNVGLNSFVIQMTPFRTGEARKRQPDNFQGLKAGRRVQKIST